MRNSLKIQGLSHPQQQHRYPQMYALTRPPADCAPSVSPVAAAPSSAILEGGMPASRRRLASSSRARRLWCSSSRKHLSKHTSMPQLLLMADSLAHVDCSPCTLKTTSSACQHNRLASMTTSSACQHTCRGSCTTSSACRHNHSALYTKKLSLSTRLRSFCKRNSIKQPG